MRYLFGLFIIFFSILVIPSSLVGYETDINYIFNIIFKKVNQNRFHSPQMFIFFDFILLKLYNYFGFVNWYLIFKYSLIWLSYTAFFFTIGRNLNLIWLGLYIFVFFVYVCVFLHHVHVAYLLCVSGIFLNYNSIAVDDSKKRNLLIALSAITYFSGFFLRWEVGALTLVWYSILLLFNFNCKSILGSLVLIIPAYLFIVSINLYFSQSSEFRNSMEPDGEFLFLSEHGYQPEQMSSLEDTIRYEMIRRFMVDDTLLISFSDMKEALKVARKSHISFLSLKQIYKSAKDVIYFPHLTIMIALCCIALIFNGKVKNLLLILLLLGSIFLRTDQIEERHFIGIFLFLFLLAFSTKLIINNTQKSILLLIFFLSIANLHERIQVQREITVEKDIVKERMGNLIKSGKVLYLSRAYKDIFPSKTTFDSDIFGFSRDNTILLTLYQESHSDLFIQYLSQYCNKDLLNIGNVYSCVAEDKNNVLAVSEDIANVLKKIINRYYGLNIQFIHLGVLCGEADTEYDFKYLTESIHLYHLEFY